MADDKTPQEEKPLENQTVFFPETKEEALAAGIPDDIFDPEVHIFSFEEQTSKYPKGKEPTIM